MNKISKFLPSLEQVSKEVIAVAIAGLLFAYVVSQSPKLKALVRDYQAP